VVADVVVGAQAFERTRGTPEWRLQTVVSTAPDLPAVPLDERQMRQALMNLLTNAYQAAARPDTHVTVDARVVEKAGRRWARVTVRDEGPGIAPEMRARLFEPFVTTKATGSGLGLAVVKRIVEGHRGELAVESEPGRGTAFFLDLPLEREEAARGPAAG
jgi:signal transduction histidine kinase